ncbi:MAG: CinA family protein [Lachnospiraceae bacterium]|nr:CinA family protein [Lachnospiraceae bacterium]
METKRFRKTQELYRQITEKLIEKEWTVTTMESCTAGFIASLLTDTEGSSAILKGAYVTYSNAAKVAQGVPATVITRFGVYSPETAEMMAHACRDSYQADIGIGITGSFGNPDPNNRDSVIGSVYVSIDLRGKVRSWHLSIPQKATRFDYKTAAAEAVGEMLWKLLNETEERKD